MFERIYRRTSVMLALMSMMVIAGLAALAPAQSDHPATPPASPPSEHPEHPTKQAEPAKPTADMPKAEELFDKAIEAMGGKGGEFKNIESMHVVANFAIPGMPNPAKITITRDNKNRFLFVQEDPRQGGSSTIGTDGEVVWVNNAMMGGYQLLEGPMKDMLLQQIEGEGMIFRHDIIAKLKSEAKEMQTAGSEKFGEEDAWKVNVVDKDLSASSLYFAKDTHLPLGVTATQESGMGPVEKKIRFLEWKDFEPFKFYTKMEMEQGGPMGPMTITFDTIEVNKVDPKVFELPKEVKKLVEAKKQEPQPGEGETPPGGAVPHDHDGDGKPDH